jgi:hypothetical protein
VDITKEGVPVNELIAVIKESIKEAGVSTTSDTRDIKVTSVRLILKVVASKSIGGALHFRVPFIGMEFSTGGKVSTQDTHTIDIELVPPTAQVRGVRGDVEQTLVSAVQTIRAAAASAAVGDDPWVLSSGTVDISFVITKAGSISLGVEGELSHEVTHQLQLGLGPA